jgi:hypothetical protein
MSIVALVIVAQRILEPGSLPDQPNGFIQPFPDLAQVAIGLTVAVLKDGPIALLGVLHEHPNPRSHPALACMTQPANLAIGGALERVQLDPDPVSEGGPNVFTQLLGVLSWHGSPIHERYLDVNSTQVLDGTNSKWYKGYTMNPTHDQSPLPSKDLLTGIICQ